MQHSMMIFKCRQSEVLNKLILVSNTAFAAHFNYQPISIDDPAIKQSNYKFE